MYTHRKNLLDVYRVHGAFLGVFREAFDRVMELQGFDLKPVNGAPEVWEFRNAAAALRGRLLSVASFLHGDPVALTTKGRLYMITRQDFTLALLLPGVPRRMRLNETRHKPLPLDGRPPYPADWPSELVLRVIRARFRNIVILKESYLLQQIGLRAPQ